MGKAPFIVTEDLVGGPIIQHWKFGQRFSKLSQRPVCGTVGLKSRKPLSDVQYSESTENQVVHALPSLRSFLSQQTLGFGILYH